MTTRSWRPLAAAAMVVALLPSLPLLGQEQAAGQTPPQQQPVGEILPEDKPFWDNAQQFVDAYAKREAAAIGELFTEDAEFHDEFGELTVGREAIVALFQSVFDASPEAMIDEIQIERVRHLSADMVLEDGTVYSSVTSDGPRHSSRYVAIHAKGSDGLWRINTLKDYPREGAGHREQVQQLSWLVGQWVNENEDSVVHTNCGWSSDRAYLLREFTIRTRDGREMSGLQRTGWDPALKKLRSWTFDSEGGFFQGLWTKNDDQWLLTSSGVTAGGHSVTAMSVYTIIDQEMVTWQVKNLIVGDEVRTENEPITMVRRPPQPMQADQ